MHAAYTHTYIHNHTYYGDQMFHSVLFNRGDGHPGTICRWHVHHPRYKSVEPDRL